MRVFLDTNVLVSAFTTEHGTCASLLRLVLTKYDLVVSEFIISELKRILTERFKTSSVELNNVLSVLYMYEVIPTPLKPYDISINDNDDKWVLASVIDAKADVLITGDQELLSIGNIGKIKILSPRGFINLTF
ncbi:MAG: putative toxin-antitoxin system toxin component, PIN family [Nitrospirae bacterium]|nr:putative toxin-antitoxin system toxin component, PIN family [Nitrospirota bacterium]MBF0541201.1 putative toxin-antitoxin system toxin component, PIN family [Nitrospirota bacterium]